MIYFTKYAEQKFDILNRHKVYITREDVVDAINSPDKTEKRGKYLFAVKENVKVVYKNEGEVKKIYTFYPVK
jgi:predicted HTH transcriptional regulator